MVEIMDDTIKATIAKAMNVANYIFICCDEVTSVDN
jgi:hypothetical protein